MIKLLFDGRLKAETKEDIHVMKAEVREDMHKMNAEIRGDICAGGAARRHGQTSTGDQE